MTSSSQAQRRKTSGQRTPPKFTSRPMAQGDKVNSWMMGANSSKEKPRVLVYFMARMSITTS